jgi:uncharacterized protein YcgI (DUF1989 family)
VRAYKGLAVPVRKGQLLQVINTSGYQVRAVEASGHHARVRVRVSSGRHGLARGLQLGTKLGAAA